jgi:hypothetical protein
MQETTPESVTPTPTPEAASKKITEQEMRAMRRQFVTIRLGTVRACGHKIDSSKPPKNNCEWCWEAYFKTNDNMLVTLHEFLVTRGLPAFRAQFGNKLVKHFARLLDRELNVRKAEEVDTEAPVPYNEVRGEDEQNTRDDQEPRVPGLP